MGGLAIVSFPPIGSEVVLCGTPCCPSTLLQRDLRRLLLRIGQGVKCLECLLFSVGAGCSVLITISLLTSDFTPTLMVWDCILGFGVRRDGGEGTTVISATMSIDAVSEGVAAVTGVMFLLCTSLGVFRCDFFSSHCSEMLKQQLFLQLSLIIPVHSLGTNT